MVLVAKYGHTLIVTMKNSILCCNFETKKHTELEVPAPVLPEQLKEDQKEIFLRERKTVNSIDVSVDNKYVLFSLENKQVLIYEQQLKLVKNFTVKRAPSKACFTPSNDIIVADKTGDVYLYTLNENRKPQLLLGHLSMILDIAVTTDGKYIITCDRDEKIRVSHYPNCYNIATFCLGHSSFVTCIKVVDKVMISASGDGDIKFWDFVNGKELSTLHTNDYIKDNSALQEFSEEMDKEKVDVTALPIINMQICGNFMIVQLHRYNGLQLYYVNLDTCETQYLNKLCLTGPFNFCFNDFTLYVVCDTLRTFKIDNNAFIEIQSEFLNKLFNSYKSMIEHSNENSVTVLYKRKFDNIQDYFDRKKQRLECQK